MIAEVGCAAERGHRVPERDVPTLVKRLRAQMGLTQEQFAQTVGVTYSTINQWENSRRHPQPYLWNRLLEIERSLGTSEKGGSEKRKGVAKLATDIGARGRDRG